MIILDEAQRIKNFSTKTADAVKRIPRGHALVLTGTPLENKLEDVYSIVQFLDPRLLSPLWSFAADHFMLSRHKKGKILGYRNLDRLQAQLKSIVIRRRKEEVLSDLPEEVVNNYYIDLHDEQLKIHNGYLSSLLPLINKKFLTPMDLRRIQELLLRMRMVCNSTYLIDRKTHISPKLKELEGVVDELVVQMVIFSEWTTMTFLIARNLSEAGIPFVELSNNSVSAYSRAGPSATAARPRRSSGALPSRRIDSSASTISSSTTVTSLASVTAVSRLEASIRSSRSAFKITVPASSGHSQEGVSYSVFKSMSPSSNPCRFPSTHGT